MTQPLRFTVLTPTGPIVESQAVNRVRVRLVDGGLLSVYPSHAPLIAETIDGEVVYDVVEGHQEMLQLQGGILFVYENTITLYTSGSIEDGSEERASHQDGEEFEEDRSERFDRLAEVLLSTLRADPREIHGGLQTEDTELS